MAVSHQPARPARHSRTRGHDQRSRTVAPRRPPERASRSGGVEANARLTRVTAAVLVMLLVAEGITITSIEGLVRPHMFIGLVLIPPIALKLATTGYRFMRYYAGSAAYREKGPPALVLRLTAPVLVLATIALFTTGVWLLVLGHGSDSVVSLHAASAIVWVAAFAIHLAAHGRTVLRSLGPDWRSSLVGPRAGALLVAAALGGGVALALALLGLITGWHGE